MNLLYREQKIKAIAFDTLNFTTLEARGADRYDFKEVSVWGMRDALVAAYNAGYDAGLDHCNKALEVALPPLPKE